MESDAASAQEAGLRIEDGRSVKAYVDQGLLDRILKTPEGHLLEITPADADSILASGIFQASGLEVCAAIYEGRDFQLLGRRVHVKY